MPMQGRPSASLRGSGTGGVRRDRTRRWRGWGGRGWGPGGRRGGAEGACRAHRAAGEERGGARSEGGRWGGWRAGWGSGRSGAWWSGMACMLCGGRGALVGLCRGRNRSHTLAGKTQTLWDEFNRKWR